MLNNVSKNQGCYRATTARESDVQELLQETGPWHTPKIAMQNRREFFFQAAQFSGGASLAAVLLASVERALAIEADRGPHFNSARELHSSFPKKLFATILQG